ncbi:unannotated protein [freshwater metagenome]|uniref:Unannotated protein n=1 Tax=freshwater metagenome TaxID=449393 RepID=A0A6J7SEN5_9ZZZZ
MSTQAWLIFVALSLVWGVPYLFIKIAVTEVEPMPLTGIRTLMAALILLPFALRSGSLRAALRAWPWVVAFALIEIALPWALLAHSEERISSGFAAVMIATVPIVGSLISWIEGDRHALTRVRVVGLVTGVVGVAILVGIDSLAGHIDLISLLELVIIAVCSAVGPMMADRKLHGIRPLGVITLTFVFVSILTMPWTVAGLRLGLPSGKVLVAIAVLALISTVALTLFLTLIAKAGPVRATVVTFVNPGVAVILGIIVLSEPLTLGTIIGFPLVILGSYLTTRPHPGAVPDPHSAVV